jgi:tetratricopeptide (TPR) repeat protein
MVHHIRRGLALLAAMLLLALQGAYAQQSILTSPLPTSTVPTRNSEPAEIGSGIEKAKPLTPAGSAAVQAAYAQSREANSIADYTKIIELCDAAIAGQSEEAVRDYALQLLAWAANRRGEAYSDEAAQLGAQGKAAEAKARDQLALTDFNLAVTSDVNKWKAWHNRGVSQALVGKYEVALYDLTKALELNQSYVNTWFNRAEVRYELGQYEDAVSDYTEVIVRQPDDFGAFTGRGHAHFRMGEMTKALADYERAVSLDAKSPGALVNRGDTHRQLGHWGEAAADYRAAIKLDPRYGRGYRAAAWLMATCPDDKYQSADLAIRAAEQAIELDGAQDYLYLDTLAAAYASAGKYSEAVTAAQQAIAAAPEEAQLAVKERLALYQSGQLYRLGFQTAARPTPARR